MKGLDMPRNISFSLTTRQIRERTKTVTRRKGWRFLKPGDLLNACVKCMGLRRRKPIDEPKESGWYDVQWDDDEDNWERIWINVTEFGTTWGLSPEDDPESLDLDGNVFAFAIPGEKIERLCQIRVVSVRREPLSEMIWHTDYGYSEARKEGFVGKTGAEFVRMFCRHMGGEPNQEVTRIEFEYLD